MELPFSRLDGRVLPISRQARARFGLERDPLPTGGATPEDFLHAARRLADRVNGETDLLLEPEKAVSAGRLHALALVSSFLGSLLAQYRRDRQADILSRAVGWLEERFGPERIGATWRAVDELFPLRPPAPALADDSFPRLEEPGLPEPPEPRPEDRLEALLVIWALNDNPAAGPWRQLFDDRPLEEATGYRDLLASLGEFFARQPGLGPDDESFLDLVRAPARVAPDSLAGQLRFIGRVSRGRREDPPPREVLVGLDVLREEEKPIFVGPGGAPGPGPPEVLDFAGLQSEEERFSADRSWMPELVLVAKNVFVWLDQLSTSYGRKLERLDQIPDRELDRLARWGMSGLWLIGLWQRSEASRRIKELCGNPEAAASAYSLEDYRIAGELGGDEALEDLSRRAAQRGIRLACDMVPNHFGIDSSWLAEYPERFLSLPRPPFPGYRFQGPDLSADPRVGLYLEDGYYSRQDAAVVFLRRDRLTGEEQFVYHGNDGTGLPWNDTAQLDYLQQETREAVIEAIIAVARKFPIIRFDAAMTLARRHVQRLWYPQPGQGGDIPSRAAFGLSSEEFQRRMPREFWREVVDRLAREVPDTLLLAEAFWLMEGYFVRTLGMHRVYHSAFMHMLRDEDNAGFRRTLRNTLEFNPEILKRFVNYLTNPDEASAAAQFGTGEKYFGCLHSHGDPARPAHVRPWPGGGSDGEVRHGVPPCLFAGGAGGGSTGTARATDRPAAGSPPPICRSEAISLVRFRTGSGHRRRECPGLLQWHPLGRREARTGIGGVPQPRRTGSRAPCRLGALEAAKGRNRNPWGRGPGHCAASADPRRCTGLECCRWGPGAVSGLGHRPRVPGADAGGRLPGALPWALRTPSFDRLRGRGSGSAGGGAAAGGVSWMGWGSRAYKEPWRIPTSCPPARPSRSCWIPTGWRS